jgi:Rho-binding antiterminator
VSDYRAITCSDHERLELAALKRQWLDLTVMTGERTGSQRLLPLDVYTRDGAESQSGEQLTLRLDWLRL